MGFNEDGKFWECTCGDRAYLQTSFHEDWAALKAQGWRAYRDAGGFLHECPECRAADIAKHGGASVLDRPLGLVKK